MLKNSHLTDRADISDFIIHFTRDSNEKSALENLISILNDMKIRAKGYHCLFNNSLNEQSETIREHFNVVCFTETPLQNLRSFFTIQNKRKHFKPYGIIFSKASLKDYEKIGMMELANHPNSVFLCFRR